MNQKTALILAVALTAFVLVIGGALAGRAAQPAAAAGSAVTTTATIDVQTILAQREAEYQARLDEANKALAAAYAAQSATSAPEITAVPTNDPATQPAATPNVKLTPQGAMSAAIIAVPGAKILKMPELVNFQGTVAYEVKLDQGVVYVNANNGAILYNGTTQTAAAQAPSQNNNGGGGHHEDDHNGGDD